MNGIINFQTSLGTTIMIRSVDIKPKSAALIKLIYVHNEADVQRIQTLQQQLDEQAAKLKTITDLLFKNGAI